MKKGTIYIIVGVAVLAFSTSMFLTRGSVKSKYEKV